MKPRFFNESLSSEFVEVMADMMQKDPADRIPTAADVIRRLAPWAEKSVPGPIEGDATAGSPPRPNSPPPVVDELDDTAANFVEPLQMPGTDTPSQTSQWTEPVASAAQETLPSVDRNRRRRKAAGPAAEESQRLWTQITIALVALGAGGGLLLWLLHH